MKMNNKKSTKRALLSSVLSLVLCMAMLIGTTFAWFTDNVTSGGNIIKSGKLDVTMEWAEGDEDPTADATAWKDASTGPIFKSELWEPGYTEAKHIKVSNIGTLALKYQMRILANGVVSELADVIDVYYIAPDADGNVKAISRADLKDDNKIGTLSNVLNNASDVAISKKIAGSLEAGKSNTVTIALKMQESAGNEYQNLSIGTDFSIQLLATQMTSEEDSFDKTYDTNADFAAQEKPSAMVYALSPSKLQSITIGGVDGNPTLDTGYSFQPTETYKQALESKYSWAHADFFVYADATVPANSMALAGYYNAFNGLTWGGQTLSPTHWIGLSSPVDVAAGKDNGIRLIADGMNGGSTSEGITIPYNVICDLGNDGTGFLCGASDLTGANAGTTLTVELRLYETYPEGECPADHNGHSSKNCETGEYIVVGTTTYTFPERPLTVKSADELAAAVAEGHTNLYLADGEYDVYGCGGKTLTISGSENAIIKLYNDGEDGCDYAFGSAGTGVGDYTFNGVTIDTTGNTGNYKGFAYMKGTFNDCNFIGAYSLNNANDFVFNNCTFDFKSGYLWTWGAKSVTFNGCTFTGNSNTILAHGTASTVININNCDFAATEKGYTAWNPTWTAAVEIDPVNSNTYTINFTGENTITDNYAGWTRVKDGSTGHVINGVN